MPTISEKRKTFRALHAQGCFVIPNPWDVGSARYLQSLGFKALATTSAGFAFSHAKPDGGVTLDDVLAHCRTMVEACDLPINVDFEHGYAQDFDGLTRNVRACVDTGIAGLSIEDATGDKTEPLFAFDDAVARMRTARKAIDDSRQDVLLVGRAEGFLVGRPDLDDVVRRLKAYADAGADVLYAPLIKTREQIETVVTAVAPKPVNFLNSANFGFSVDDLTAMGVRRISVGGSLARVAWTAFTRSAKEIAAHGTFKSFDGTMSNAELNAFFADDQNKRNA
jgi:2-methylisocitrate lyase-like PEP mutase family enzyme